MTLRRSHKYAAEIIPYQELLGNYDVARRIVECNRDYTIPRAIREL